MFRAAVKVRPVPIVSCCDTLRSWKFFPAEFKGIAGRQRSPQNLNGLIFGVTVSDFWHDQVEPVFRQKIAAVFYLLEDKGSSTLPGMMRN